MRVIEEVCTITANGQTNIPEVIRQALGVGGGSRIVFRIEDGTVSVHATGADEDPALAPFLTLLENDIATRPESLVPLHPELATRLSAMTEGVEIDLEGPIEGEVAL